mgnify:FL=1
MKKILIRIASKIINKYGTVKINTGTKLLCCDGRYYTVISTTTTNDLYNGATFEFNCKEIVPN